MMEWAGCGTGKGVRVGGVEWGEHVEMALWVTYCLCYGYP